MDRDSEDWTLRWPATVDRLEVWEGNLAFELRGFTPEKVEWTAADVTAARLVYPDQQIALSEGRRYMFVGPTAEALAARMATRS